MTYRVHQGFTGRWLITKSGRLIDSAATKVDAMGKIINRTLPDYRQDVSYYETEIRRLRIRMIKADIEIGRLRALINQPNHPHVHPTK
jgi:hypothetical protein